MGVGMFVASLYMCVRSMHCTSTAHYNVTMSESFTTSRGEGEVLAGHPMHVRVSWRCGVCTGVEGVYCSLASHLHGCIKQWWVLLDPPGGKGIQALKLKTCAVALLLRHFAGKGME